MKYLIRKVVLIERIQDQREIDWSRLKLDEKEAFILEPFKLYVPVD